MDENVISPTFSSGKKGLYAIAAINGKKLKGGGTDEGKKDYLTDGFVSDKNF